LSARGYTQYTDQEFVRGGQLVTEDDMVAYRKSARVSAPGTPETWVDDGRANTLNSFDTGDVRTTHAVVASAYSIREDAKANTFSATPIDAARCLQKQQPSVQSHHAQTFIAKPPDIVRRLSPIECERLMGWPDNWTAPEEVKAPDSRRYAACGDGIVANVAYWIGQRIMQIDKETQ
jgi:site-specific DNA-cytosine methylase